MSDLAARSRITDSGCFFFLCDMQEMAQPFIRRFADIAEVAQKMVSVARILNIPVLASEHKGFGHTVDNIDISRAKVISKTSFSMLTKEVEEELNKNPTRNSVVLFGIMTECCIQQTTLDLLQRGYNVHVVVDGCSSRSQLDHTVVIEHLRTAGAFITTSTNILFELVRDTKHKKYNEIQKLMITPSKNTTNITSKL
ncbi:isochorismatase domain-containing protein 2-like [Dysidea avara]|uniref:isochorismatase domain-containing protein 2-like n=1 Tax=Dysidea avara TaxID=196820 RepID=UPI00331BFBEE